MACGHQKAFKVYRRGPAPAYAFLPLGEYCPSCRKLFTIEVKGGNDQ